jgi:hypothetical protein
MSSRRAAADDFVGAERRDRPHRALIRRPLVVGSPAVNLDRLSVAQVVLHPLDQRPLDELEQDFVAH